MEETLRQLQELQIEALRRQTPVFNITAYHWNDDGDVTKLITIRVIRDEKNDEDSCYFSVHAGNESEAVAAIAGIKHYLGL